MGVVDDLAQAREAYERRDWMAAYNALSAADPAALDGEDFVRLAMTADLLGRRNDCVQALQRAYRLHLDAGDVLAAVRSAFWLAMTLTAAGEPSVGGWLGLPGRAPAGAGPGRRRRARLRAVCAAARAHLLGRVRGRRRGGGRTWRTTAGGSGRTTWSPWACAAQGRLSMYSGRMADGLRLLDEAMVAVSSGELSPVFAGHVYCTMIEGCQEVSDYGRVAEWTAALHAWCATQPDLVLFIGQCALHRGQIMRVQGAWPAAIEEFDLAVERYVRAGTPAPAGIAVAERGDVQRLTGDLDAAEASYALAGEYGFEPQPGLALLWHARGRTLRRARRRTTAAGGAARPRAPRAAAARVRSRSCSRRMSATRRGRWSTSSPGSRPKWGVPRCGRWRSTRMRACCWRGRGSARACPGCARRSRCGEAWAPATRWPGAGRWWGVRAGFSETRIRPGSSSRPPATSVASWAPGRSRRS